MTTSAEAPAATEQGLRRVGLWGATASGKSTFLSALFIAATRSPEDLRVKGVNDESTDFLIRNTHTLNAQRRFPPPTSAQQPLSWTLQMPVPNRARGGGCRAGPPAVPFDFRVDLQDAPGRAYAAVPESEPAGSTWPTGPTSPKWPATWPAARACCCSSTRSGNATWGTPTSTSTARCCGSRSGWRSRWAGGCRTTSRSA